MISYCLGCMEHLENSDSVCPQCGFDLSQYSAEPHQLLPGTLLQNRYLIGRVLGEGGFGITYVGRDTVLDLKVAVKEFYMTGYVNRNNTYSTVVQASMGTHAETFEKNREKFLTEARVLAKFANEDGIVGIRDFFQENNTAYIVMDFLNGQTLKAYLQDRDRLSIEETLELIDPILISLSHVHQHDVIHRDISPDNIMLTTDHQVKLLDFGAARQVSKKDINSLSVILKPGYAPEEQYRSKGLQGPWTDVYALSATIYRCVTGIVPDDAMERMFADHLATPAELADIPIACSNVIMKGLAVRQIDRYQSVDEFRDELHQALNDPTNPSIASDAGKPGNKTARDPEATVYADAPILEDEHFNDSETPPQREKHPRPKKKAQPKHKPDKPNKKKKPIAIAIIAGIIVLIAVALGITLLGKPKSPSQSKTNNQALDTMPTAFSSYSFTLNDREIQLPTLYKNLEKEGWITEKEDFLSKKVKPGEIGDYEVTNGYGYFTVKYRNPTSNVVTVEECPIDGIAVQYSVFTDNYLNEIRNSLSMKNGFVLGQTTESEFKEKAPSGYKYSYGGYEYKVDYTDSVTFIFHDGIWKSLFYYCPNAAHLLKDSYETTAPEYDKKLFNDTAAMVEVLTVDDIPYMAGVPISDYVDAGWVIEKAPEYIASGDTDKVYMRWNTTTTVVLEVFNPFLSALVPQYCYVTNVSTYDLNGEIKLVIEDKENGLSLTIPKETTREDVRALLTSQDKYRIEPNFSSARTDAYYYSNDNNRLIVIGFTPASSEEDFIISSIKIDTTFGLKAFRAELLSQ